MTPCIARRAKAQFGWRACAAASACALLATASALARDQGAAAQPASLSHATANFAPQDPPGEWRRSARDYANTRYSPLEQINRENVQRLRVAWTFSDGEKGGHEAAPLVVGDTMYLVAPFPNEAYALDLTRPGAPIKWSFTPNPAPIAQGKACCDVVNRGAAYADGRIIYNLLDGHAVAVDAQTGKELWRTALADVSRGETLTMAPFVVHDKVYVGNSGGEMGVAGWLAALDVKSGKELWRAYSVGPDDKVRIGADFKPPYDWLKGKDLGVTTWPKDMWKTGGGAVWAWISYDPDTNLIYYGTSNPGPRVPEQRPGLNLWTSAVFARDADTGMAKWAYQFTPHDQWDYDGVNENVLLDLPFDGKQRKVLVHLDRNGFGYTIDRLTGEVLVAQPFGHQNWSSGIDLKSGKPQVIAAMQPKIGVELKNVCPPDIGVKDWQPSAFSPHTGLIYAGIFNICMDLTDHRVGYIAGTPYDGMEMARHPASGERWGGFIAWDPLAGRKVFELEEPYMVMSGVLATASDLVFYGTVDGWFRAVDARSGEVRWSQKLGSGVIGQPITFLGPDHRQYVAVYAGVGGAAVVSKSAFPAFPARGSTLYVFSVDGQSPGTEAMSAEAAPAQQQSKGGQR
jgi:alcohol dehydrogenase (cytochrome c)